MNSILIHYDYGWKRYREIIEEECNAAGINIILMTFGVRTFLAYSDWKKEWFAKDCDGKPFTERLECETHLCRFQLEALEAFDYGARQWLKSVPGSVKQVHMRAADGLMFCRCPKCAPLPDHEKWQVFVEIFTRAVQETRPDLQFETDVYVKRYNIPHNTGPFRRMSNIMYDTFYRDPFHPIGSRSCIGSEYMRFAATEEKTDADTPNAYHAKRLREWCTTFPGKVYIHENAMAQSLFGVFQHNTSVLLKDLERYRTLGIQGVCYEAYEPGYSGFSDMFEILADAMNGKEINYSPQELERILPKTGMRIFCTDPDFPLEKYLMDPFALKQAKLYCEFWRNPTVDLYRRYLDFAFEHEDSMDALMIGFGIAQYGRVSGIMSFTHLSPEADDLLHRRKLWDFMEDIPLSEDPRAVCRDLILELAAKAESS